MFHNKFARLCKIIITALFLNMVLATVAMAEQKAKLKGHVLAVSSGWMLCYDPMHGKNRLQAFIFGVEFKGRGDGKPIVPVHVCYSNYPGSDNFLPEDFFDYSKKYELSLIRIQVGPDNKKKNLEIPFEEVAYITFALRDEDGNYSSSYVDKRLPMLEILDGVPENILNMDMDVVLTRYRLSTTKYKIINEKSKK